jgi:hypothetical protein
MLLCSNSLEIMKRTLELIVWPKLRKDLELGQTLDCLSVNLQEYCSSLRIESQNGGPYILYAEWPNSEQMRRMLQSREFSILSGAVEALCKRSDIRLDGKPFKYEIKKLSIL